MKITEEGALGLHIEMLLDMLDYTRFVGRLGLQLLVNRTRTPYTTSDQPVVRWNDLPPRPGGGGRLGLASPGIQLRMPISPRFCLVAYNLEVYGRFSSRREVLMDDEIQNERRLQLSQAWCHVFSTARDPFDLERGEFKGCLA